MILLITATVDIPSGQPLSNEQIMQALRGLAVSVSPGTIVPADLASYLLLCPANLTELRDVDVTAFAPRALAAHLRGGASVGDGKEGSFVWDNSWAGTDDGLDTIAPTAGGTGRWRRITPPMSFYRQPTASEASLTVANGANHNVALTANTGTLLVSGPTAVFNITGLTGGTAGRTVVLINKSAYAMTLTDDSSSSTAANRFRFASTPADVTLAPYASIRLTYSATDSRWYRS